MRPKTLSIQGLHSFMDEQTIDFERLCSRGLFGIFGPTGSGKSTILDGITLALYGKIARESKTFINASQNLCAVSYTFYIGNHQYRINRRFKKDPKSGNSRNDSAILVDLSSNEEIVLASDVRGVNEYCEHLIGLSLHDFTHTVVLPQGKFSEFLKLEGKDRRDMLERLFHLEQYGNELSTRLSLKLSQARLQLSILEGQLSMLEADSEEAYQQAKQQLSIIQKEHESKKEEESILSKQVQEWLDQLQVQEELIQLQTKKEQLLQQSENIHSYQKKCDKADKAKLINPNLLQKQQAEQAFETNRLKFQELKTKQEELKEKKEQVDEMAKLSQRQKEEVLPKIQLAIHTVGKLITDIETRDQFLLQEKELRQASTKTADELTLSNSKIAGLERLIEKTKQEINELEMAKQQFTVSTLLRETVQKGQRLEERIADDEKVILQLTNKLETMKQKLADTKISIHKQEETCDKLRLQLTQTKNEVSTTLSLIPSPDDLLVLQANIRQSKEQESNIALKKDKLQELSHSILEVEEKLQHLHDTKDQLTSEFTRIQNRLAEEDLHQMAATLRSQLKDETPCLVCGSIHHNKTSSHQEVDQNKRSDEQKRMDELSTTLKSIDYEFAQYEAKRTFLLAQQTEFIKEVEQLHSGFDASQLELWEKEAEHKQSLMEQHRISLEKMQSWLGLYEPILIEEDKKLTTLQTLIQNQLQQIEECKDQLQAATSSRANQAETLRQNSAEFSQASQIKSFLEKAKEIRYFDEQVEHCDNTLKILRKQVETNQIERNDLQQKISMLKEQSIEFQTKLAYVSQQITQLQKMIDETMPDQSDVYEYEKVLKRDAALISTTYEETKNEQAVIHKAYQEANEQLISLTSTLQENTTVLASSEKRLHEEMVKYGFSYQREIHEAMISDEIYENLRQEIKEHENALVEVNSFITKVQRKHLGLWLDQTEVASAKEALIHLERTVLELQDTISKKDGDLQRMKINLEQKTQLLREHKQASHSYGLLVELEKLFKGKRFVEFAAMNQLQYVALQANDRLRDITKGMYGLELDETGLFLIRDYKNGGIARDVSTLSGGETFLASLSLALALSAQIQLKGRSPLELFFLDEGFGTLDENYLEVVMSSLERIHHDKLKIGLISHVESIKNRIPIKLLVTPSVAGEGGSKVKIELT